MLVDVPRISHFRTERKDKELLSKHGHVYPSLNSEKLRIIPLIQSPLLVARSRPSWIFLPNRCCCEKSEGSEVFAQVSRQLLHSGVLPWGKKSQEIPMVKDISDMESHHVSWSLWQQNPRFKWEKHLHSTHAECKSLQILHHFLIFHVVTPQFPHTGWHV